MNRKANVACNFNCLIKTEGLLKVTASHVVYRSGNILEMVQATDVVTGDREYIIHYCKSFQMGFFVQLCGS